MVVVIVVVIVVAIVVALAVRSRRRADPVDSFRRQIDALSPEARRPTISQFNQPDADPDEDDDGTPGAGTEDGTTETEGGNDGS